MFVFNARTRENSADFSPRTMGSPATGIEVGEIDTRAPFQSVKAAVSLFADSNAPSPMEKNVVKKSKTPDERVLEKETQHHLAMKELDKYKEQLRMAENTKAQALQELEIADKTLGMLTTKLEALSGSKQAAIQAAEDARTRMKQLEEQISSKREIGDWKEVVDKEREQYRLSAGLLIPLKQELANLRQDFDAALEAKLAAVQEASDAQQAAHTHQERLAELSREISSLRDTLCQMKIASNNCQEEHAAVLAEKDACLQFNKASMEEVEKKMKSLKEEYERKGDLEMKLEETNEAIEIIQEQLKNVRASDVGELRSETLELDNTKRSLQDVLAEECSIRNLVILLQEELDSARRENTEMEENASRKEVLAECLQDELSRTRVELQQCLQGQNKASDDAKLKFQQLSAESNSAAQEAEELKNNVEALKQEAETFQTMTKEVEEELNISLKEAEIAKAAEKHAASQISSSSATSDVNGQATNLERKQKIILSNEKYEALQKKVEECKAEAEMKVATAMAQVESINVKERETLTKLEAATAELEKLEADTKEALKQAVMAEAAKLTVESELRKWRIKEKNAVEDESSSSREDAEL